MTVSKQSRTSRTGKVEDFSAPFLDQAISARILDGQRIGPQLADTGEKLRIAFKEGIGHKFCLRRNG